MCNSALSYHFLLNQSLFRIFASMSKQGINKNQVIAAAKKMVETKKAVIAYSNGEISKKELSDRGIKLAMPL